MRRKNGFKVKRTRKNLYKRRKSTGRKIFEGVLFVIILGGLVFIGYSVASPLLKFFGGDNQNSSAVSEPVWVPPESSDDDTSSDGTSTESSPQTTTEKPQDDPTENKVLYAA